MVEIDRAVNAKVSVSTLVLTLQICAMISSLIIEMLENPIHLHFVCKNFTLIL